jgi:hypothetical protein
MDESVTLSSADNRAVEQLICAVKVCDRDSFIMRSVSTLLNCPLAEVCFIVYRLWLFISSISPIRQYPTMYSYNADLIQCVRKVTVHLG